MVIIKNAAMRSYKHTFNKWKNRKLQQINSLHKETEHINKTQMEILELKNIKAEIKSSADESTAEKKGQRKESVNCKIEQYILLKLTTKRK